MATLRLRLLGGFDARVDTAAPLELRRKKAKALLAYLAVNAGQAQSREKIAGLLWGNSDEEQARANLRQMLSELRKSFPEAVLRDLRIDGEEFSLDPGAAEVDVTAFTEAVAEGTPPSLQRAADLYRGELLAGFSLREEAFEEWLAGERARAPAAIGHGRPLEAARPSRGGG